MPPGQPQSASSPSDIAARILATDSVAKAFDARVTDVGAGHVTVVMTVGAGMVNGHGTGHGAVLFALADLAFAIACNSYGVPAVGRSCAIEYLAPAQVGDEIEAVAVERSRAGRHGIYDVAIRRVADGALLAEFRGHSRLTR